MCVAQLDFARAPDPAWHTAMANSMQRRNVPRPLTVKYVKDISESKLAFRHGLWATESVFPTGRSKQGCSASPMIFRWLLDDVLEELSPKWEAEERGIVLDGRRIFMMYWADDTWVFGATGADLEAMARDVRPVAGRRAGIIFRLHECTWSHVQRQEQNPSKCGPKPRFRNGTRPPSPCGGAGAVRQPATRRSRKNESSAQRLAGAMHGGDGPSKRRIKLGQPPSSNARAEVRVFVKRHWDDAIQGTVLDAGHQIPWQQVAQDRELWKSLETEFIRRVIRTMCATVGPVPGGRWVLDETHEHVYIASSDFTNSRSKKSQARSAGRPRGGKYVFKDEVGNMLLNLPRRLPPYSLLAPCALQHLVAVAAGIV